MKQLRRYRVETRVRPKRPVTSRNVFIHAERFLPYKQTSFTFSTRRFGDPGQHGCVVVNFDLNVFRHSECKDYQIIPRQTRNYPIRKERSLNRIKVITRLTRELPMTAPLDSPQTIVTGGGCRAQAADLLSAMRAHRTLLVVDPYFASAEFVMRSARIWIERNSQRSVHGSAAGSHGSKCHRGTECFRRSRSGIRSSRSAAAAAP